MNNVTLYHGDCNNIIDFIPDKSIDLICTDIPYAVSKENNIKTMADRKGRNGLDFGKWDKDFDVHDLLPVITKLRKGGSLVLFHSFEQYSQLIQVLTPYLFLKDRFIWEKTNPMPRNADRRYVVNIEMGSWWTTGSDWTFNRQSASYDGCVMRYPSESGGGYTRYHPTQKNVNMMKELILRHSNEGDTVLDPYMGSGSTGVACVSTNRRFIGVELDETYYGIAKQRIAAAEQGASLKLSKSAEKNKSLF